MNFIILKIDNELVQLYRGAIILQKEISGVFAF
jgi:hypothetical protein